MTSSNDYDFKVEMVADTVYELLPILERNHKETGVYDMPFNPDFKRYLYVESIGGLALMTARLNSKIVGYSIFFVDEAIYQKGVVMATQSATFVDEQHRGIGLAFMKFCDDILRKQGVNSIWRQSTAKRNIDKVYERMGYEFVEKSFVRRF